MNIEVFYKDGQLVTTSLNVAEVTGKRHDSVIRDIERLIEKGSSRHNFVAVEFFIEDTRVDAKGESRKMYYLTKKGTAWLINRYTGDAAIDFQLAFLNRFEKMEQYILETKEHLIRLQEENMALKDGIIASLESENKALIERANSILESTNYFKVRDYFSAQGVKLTVDECKSIGFKATKYCNHKAIPIKPEFTSLGKTNTYPSNVLQMLHKQYVISNYGTLGLFN